jgi:SH3-like domain-containing protein
LVVARALLIALASLPLGAFAADFRATSDPATVLYDAPSARAKPLFIYGRDIPVEALVSVEGWTKIRDATGTIGWMQTKSLSDKRMVVVRTPAADVRAAAEEGAPVVFRAERDGLL